MPIRPIDIQNMLVRLENLSKSSTLSQISESIAKQVQEKKQKLEAIQKKEGLATIEKIKEEENQMRKIEKFKQNYQGNKDSKKKRNYYQEDEDEHTFEKKI
ncbi:MAG: hypothetical protein GYA61_04090 [Spirochaetales bacterium]|nr:hypothetical protein [Exilispira sp.]NMC67389.1 hypothetical protein [Spirochaetales bacterium]